MAGEDKAPARVAFLLAGLGLAAHLALLFFFAYPPLVDMPNHMARVWLESQALAGEELPPFYQIHYRVTPNLGIDLFMPLVLRVMSLDMGMRFCLVVVIAVYWLGPAVFLAQQGVGGRVLIPFWTVWLFSPTFLWGFLNFTLGFGLCFLTLAHHEVIFRKGGWPWGGLLLHALLVTFLFFCHLVPWGIYGLLLGCKLAWSAWRREPDAPSGGAWTPWAQALLVCLPSLVCFALHRAFVASRQDVAGLVWSTVGMKLIRPFFLFRGYWTAIDVVVLGCWLIALGLLFFGAFRQLKAHWTHLGFVVLGVLYLVMPDQIGSGTELDLRLLPAMLVCFLAALGPLSPRRWGGAFALIAIAMFLRTYSVVNAWSELSERMKRETESFEVIRDGDRVLPLILIPEHAKIYPEEHFLAWLVPEKRVLVPHLFAYADIQPLEYAPKYEACRRSMVLSETGKVTLDTERVRACFDVIWVFNPKAREVEIPDGFELAWQAPEHTGHGVRVYRRRGK